MYTIRNLKQSDLSLCAKLYVSTFNGKPWNDHWTVAAARKRLQDILDTPRFFGQVIVDGRQVIGVVLGNIERWYDRYHYNLKEMFIQPDLQGSGLGTRLMTRVRRDLLKKDVIGIYLFTSVIGGVSHFYTKNRFKKVNGMQMMSLKFGKTSR